MSKIRHTLQLLHGGTLSTRQIGAALGISKSTVSEIASYARAAGVDVFRYKIYAVQISAGMTALAGVFFAFYYNNLFPEQIFHISRSIEIILAPIIGGVGTLFGPILGAAVLTTLSEGINALLTMSGYEIPGAKQIFYGVALGLAIMFMPNGIWPAIANRLGFRRQDGDDDDDG